jgi:ABC-type Mn2+/Zn2+ transport system permease subunit
MRFLPILKFLIAAVTSVCIGAGYRAYQLRDGSSLDEDIVMYLVWTGGISFAVLVLVYLASYRSEQRYRIMVDSLYSSRPPPLKLK